MTLNATFSFDRREENQYSNKNSYKNRKSNKQVNYECALRGQEYDNADEIKDNKSSRSNKSNRSSKSVSKKKSSRLSHQNNSISHNTKSGSRSTVYRKIKEDEQEEEEEEKTYTKKSTKKKKMRKGKMMTKTIVMDEYECKYSKIPFEDYCEKQDFKFLIG